MIVLWAAKHITRPYDFWLTNALDVRTYYKLGLMPFADVKHVSIARQQVRGLGLFVTLH